jgi:rhodanese-related sulfurtransferase/DNA-binding transcriptional ArsR family regulator
MMSDEHSEFSERLFDQLARVSKAIASPRRLELIDALAQVERTVDELARLTSMSVANTSRHLQMLRAARLVAVRRSGLHAHYRLADDGVFRLWQAVRDLGLVRLSSVRELVRSRAGAASEREPIPLGELADGWKAGEVLLLDARPEREFRAAHIPGAINIPIDELEARLHVLPAEQEVVAYSRGPYCPLSDQAVTMLEANGYRARRFALGLPDWRAAGLPVESA